MGGIVHLNLIIVAGTIECGMLAPLSVGCLFFSLLMGATAAHSLLDDLEADVDDAQENMGVVMGKLGKLLKTNGTSYAFHVAPSICWGSPRIQYLINFIRRADSCSIYIIIVMVLIIAVLVFLVIYT